jgi:anthranilate synthase/aminodeoxychorismate synthase-like glutamine amidotransferase
MHLLIDNYDSFTFNIVQALGELGTDICVARNDRITVREAERLAPEALVISPGPGTPADAGVSVALIQRFAGEIPILGVCLGHQCIVAAFGGMVERAGRVMHGKVSQVYHDCRTIYDALSNPFAATRYHSLIAREETVPAELEVSAYTSDGEVMGVRHRRWPIEGVQFHPESVLTPEGKHLLANFLQANGHATGRNHGHADARAHDTGEVTYFGNDNYAPGYSQTPGGEGDNASARGDDGREERRSCRRIGR